MHRSAEVSEQHCGVTEPLIIYNDDGNVTDRRREIDDGGREEMGHGGEGQEGEMTDRMREMRGLRRLDTPAVHSLTAFLQLFFSRLQPQQIHD